MDRSMGKSDTPWVIDFLIVFSVIVAMTCVVGLADSVLHEHIQTITVAMVDPDSHQVMDTSGAIWTLDVNVFEMQTILPGDNLTLLWCGGDWLPVSASNVYVISGLRDPVEIHDALVKTQESEE